MNLSWWQPRFHADIESDILSDSSKDHWRGRMQKKLRERDGSNLLPTSCRPRTRLWANRWSRAQVSRGFWPVADWCLRCAHVLIIKARSQRPRSRSRSISRSDCLIVATEAEGSHQSCVFLEEVGSVRAVKRITNSRVFNVVCQELLSTALPGRPSKQAPRVPPAAIVAHETMVVDVSAHSHFRVFAWWLLVEIWATLRFCDHRDICPADVKVQPTGFTARLTHSKTLGTDRSILCRKRVIGPCCTGH